MITLLLKIVLFLTQSEWSTQRIINKTPSLNREGWGGSLVWVSLHPPHTLYTLLNRVQGLCLSAFQHPYTLKSKISYTKKLHPLSGMQSFL